MRPRKCEWEVWQAWIVTAAGIAPPPRDNTSRRHTDEMLPSWLALGLGLLRLVRAQEDGERERANERFRFGRANGPMVSDATQALVRNGLGDLRGLLPRLGSGVNRAGASQVSRARHWSEGKEIGWLVLVSIRDRVASPRKEDFIAEIQRCLREHG